VRGAVPGDPGHADCPSSFGARSKAPDDEERTMTTPRTQPAEKLPSADVLAEMADSLRALRILCRGARRRAQRAARAGQAQVAARFSAHARLLARAAIALQRELRHALALPVAG
jgi:hypothetical protein